MIRYDRKHGRGGVCGRWFGFGLVVASVLIGTQSVAAETSILVQSTTSTKNSGLYDHLLPLIKRDTGIALKVVAVGTGQAIRNARNCDGDILLVHAKSAEQEFVADGYGVSRSDLMYNDFVIVGPAQDPAGIGGGQDAKVALAKIAASKALFASRGDDSGTHKAERRLWAKTDVDPTAASGTWYRETGSGMGATLNVGVGMGAYVLVDRATWLAFGNKSDFKVLVEGDPALFNQYGVVAVAQAKCPNVNAAAAQKVIDWLLSPTGQGAIRDYKINGTQLFFPNATHASGRASD
ncbi:MAG: substrate-binding domain-containing protein [Pseudomonadota bacterium]